MLRLPRPTIRLRLAAWYAGLLFVSGGGLLTLSYAVVRHEFSDARRIHVRIEERLPPIGSTGRARTLTLRVAPGVPPDAQLHHLPASERRAYRRARAALLEASRAADQRALRRVLIAFISALLLVTLGSIAAGWLIAGRVLRPIARITAAARSISGRTLHERIALGGPHDELRELADTFDTMLARLQEAFDSQHRFVANASHELRTPLAIIRTEVDVTLADPDADVQDMRAMAHVVRDANERMERLIASLLALARSESGVGAPRPADLAELARAAIAGEAGGVTVEAALEPAPVEGDPVLLERLAANLVENAARYNAPGGWVRVRTDADGSEARLVVENPGPRIEQDALPALLEPFRRLEGSRARATGGYGLGLAVVRAVADAHGGRVELLARKEGGLRVTVALPVYRNRTELPIPTRALG
ncbi:MAG TPA: ATP-binding protein [Solirubrobacteraceae bacterium]|nr:ATP-binding protein [Solirubrobacteraceae bacterium]